MVAAEHARQPAAAQRLRHRRGEQTAELAHRELSPPLCTRGKKGRPGVNWHAPALKLGREQRRERGRRFRATRLRAAEAPRSADQLDLSLRFYGHLDCLLQRMAERATRSACPRTG